MEGVEREDTEQRDTDGEGYEHDGVVEACLDAG